MEYICEKLETEAFNNKAFAMYFGDLTIGVLDIETTGLGPAMHKIILGGLLTFETPGMAKIEQFFAEDLDNEPDLLSAYLNAVKALDVVITYNGRHFDVPFICGRSTRYALDTSGLPYDLDLYLLINHASPLRKFLPNLKQSTVENYMGLWSQRKDLINGAESVEIYNQYLRSRDPELKRQVLLHNRDDLAQLARLLPVIEKSDFHKGLFSQGFPAGRKLHIENIELGKNHLKISGKQRGIPVNYYSFGDNSSNYKIAFQQSTASFEIVIPMFRNSDAAYIDLVSLGFDFGPLTGYSAEESGFLIIEKSGKISYMEINHFVKLFLDSIYLFAEER